MNTLTCESESIDNKEDGEAYVHIYKELHDELYSNDGWWFFSRDSCAFRVYLLIKNLYFFFFFFQTSLQIIGYAIVGITFSMQPIMKWACEKLEGFWRIIIADIFLFVSFIGTVNVWRGIWALLDIYFLPGRFNAFSWNIFLQHAVRKCLLCAHF